MVPSVLSKLERWVAALSRFGDSLGFHWATVAIAKTAHHKVKLGQTTRACAGKA